MIFASLADFLALIERVQVSVDKLLRSHRQSILIPNTFEMFQLCQETRFVR